MLAKLLDDFLNSDEESEDFHEVLAKEISVIVPVCRMRLKLNLVQVSGMFQI